MWKPVKDILPLEGKDLGEAVMALKKYLIWNNGAPTLLDKRQQALERIPDIAADMVESTLLLWVRDNWQKTVDYARSCSLGTRSTKDWRAVHEKAGNQVGASWW